MLKRVKSSLSVCTLVICAFSSIYINFNPRYSNNISRMCTICMKSIGKHQKIHLIGYTHQKIVEFCVMLCLVFHFLSKVKALLQKHRRRERDIEKNVTNSYVKSVKMWYLHCYISLDRRYVCLNCRDIFDGSLVWVFVVYVLVQSLPLNFISFVSWSWCTILWAAYYKACNCGMFLGIVSVCVWCDLF